MEIGCENFQQSKQTIAIKTFVNSFRSSGRLDSEYYQPKYNEILEKIKSYHNGFMQVNDFNLYDKNITPDDDVSYDYIELANIGKNGEIKNVEKLVGKDLPSRARRLVRKNQVLVSSIEGSLESCAIVPEELDGSFCSTGFYVLDSDKINSETLFLLFKSMPIQSLLKQNCSGTILTAINKEEFSNIPIPLIAEETQEEIARLIQQFFALQKQSKQLLENAIKAVEMAIETNEETALKWLEENNNVKLF